MNGGARRPDLVDEVTVFDADGRGSTRNTERPLAARSPDLWRKGPLLVDDGSASSLTLRRKRRLSWGQSSSWAVGVGSSWAVGRGS